MLAPRLATAWALFQGLLIEALPFLLIGVLIAGLARWFSPGGRWLRRLPTHPLLGPLAGAGLGFAYPSGHSGIGWLWGLMLADANPARAEQIRAFGQHTGDLRIACRVHWLSDVAYGRILATSVYGRLLAEPEFQADLVRAADEIAKAPVAECKG